MAEEKSWRSNGYTATTFVLLVICTATFWIAPIRAPFDSFFTIHTAYSLLHGGWGSISQFIDINPTHHSIITGADGQPYSVYPIGTVLFSLPFVMIADAVVPNFASLLRHPAVSMELEALTVAFWCAAATAMMFRLATATTRSVNIGLAAAFIFAFCSPVLSTATRALWQHGPMVVCVAATLLLLRSAESRPKLIPWIAIPVALAFLCRPLAVPFVIAVTVFVAVCHTRRLVPFVLVGAGIAVLWALFNHAVWGQILPPYYRPSHYTYQAIPWFDNVFGSLISPSRGILVFSPIFLVCFFSVALKLKNRTLDRFDVLCITVTLAYVGMIAVSPLWWAGHSYGPRFMTDVVPLLTYLMLPALQAIAGPQGGTGRQSGAIAVLFLAAASFLINAMGALSLAPYRWNSEPANIDYPENYARLWNWRDLQFLRGTALEYGYHPSLQILGLLDIIHAPPVSSDQIIDLSVTNRADATLVSGWSGPETWGVWSNGAEAHLRLPLPLGINDDLKLDFQAKAFVTDSHPSVTVTVMSAGETVGVWQFSMQASSGTRSLTIPGRLLSQEALDLTFVIDTPTSPRAVWNAEDDRLLGLGLSKIRLIW